MALPPLRRWCARWWHTTGFLSPPTLIAFVLITVGFGIGIRVNQDAIGRACHDAALDRAVQREILLIRIHATPEDPAVIAYQRMLNRIPPIQCPR